MGEDVGEWPVRLKNDVKDPALLPKNPVLRQPHQASQKSISHMTLAQVHASRVGTSRQRVQGSQNPPRGGRAQARIVGTS